MRHCLSVPFPEPPAMAEFEQVDLEDMNNSYFLETDDSPAASSTRLLEEALLSKHPVQFESDSWLNPFANSWVKGSQQPKHLPRRRTLLNRTTLYSIFVISILWLASIFVALGQCHRSCLAFGRSYETGFDTDLEPAWHAIRLHKVKFTGDLKIDKNGTVYRDIVGTQYVGMPTPEMDDAWVDIIRGGGVDLVGEEAKSVAGKTYQKPGGWHLSGTHVFHQLHCLNKLRKATHPEYYGHHDFEPQANWRMHLDHCIDYIRQSLQCSADMTSIAVDWNEARRRIVPNLEAVHTCRDFRHVQAWMLSGNRNAELHKIGSPSS
ncbi:hypothetical protein F5Y10DRAFT_259444 [Nemania abortiva]|nr:hypothetical protein F5Y10DRAFT_259444 [Nemania abortiva]